jgi:hypothetical protein
MSYIKRFVENNNVVPTEYGNLKYEVNQDDKTILMDSDTIQVLKDILVFDRSDFSRLDENVYVLFYDDKNEYEIFDILSYQPNRKWKYNEGGMIARTILQQLGGANRLRAMTGAYNFIDTGKGLSFRIKNAKANYIKITLNSLDLYNLEIGRIRGVDYKVVAEQNNIYADQLKGMIERVTGMYLSLAKGGEIEKSNNEMLQSQLKAVEHHAKELSNIVTNKTPIEAWVVGKIERAATDLSDITHYLDGAKFERGGKIENQYFGKTPKEVYELWDYGQKYEFFKDHFENLGAYSNSEYKRLPSKKYDELDKIAKDALIEHIKGGQYADGGKMPKGGMFEKPIPAIIDDYGNIKSEKKLQQDLEYLKEAYEDKLITKDEFEQQLIEIKEQIKFLQKKDKGGMMGKGGVTDDGEVKFITYKDEEIMYEPHYSKYYTNDEEFDSLEQAKKYIDSGSPISQKTINAYKKGLFAKGGKIGHYNTGRHQDRAKHNKAETWEKPLSQRKMAIGGEMMAKGGDVNFDPKKLIGLDGYNEGSRSTFDIIEIREISKDNIKVEFEYSKTMTSEKSFTLQELKDLYNGNKVNGYRVFIRKEEGGEMKWGGKVTFNDKVKAIEKSLVGKKVPTKFKRQYGQKYNEKEAHEAATNIAGSMLKK